MSVYSVNELICSAALFWYEIQPRMKTGNREIEHMHDIARDKLIWQICLGIQDNSIRAGGIMQCFLCSDIDV